MLDLTVVILTKNEENNLRKCIESFRGIAKRFVIVDSYSNDGTIDLCEELINEGQNISIYQHKFTDHASQFNWGLENTEINTTWCMRMDADEEITPELLDELRTELPKVKDEVNGIILKRRVYFLGRWIKHGGKYPELLLRIFRSGYAECEQKLMDEHIVLKSGKTIKLNNDIIDNNNKDLEWWTNKHNWYSNKEVLDYQQRAISNKEDEMLNSKVNKGQASKKRFIKLPQDYGDDDEQ